MSSDAVWQRYGESDPYYGVLTLAAYRKESIAENRTAFFSSGEQAVAKVLDRVEAAIGPVRTGHALDFGAGVGRLSLPLAKRFSRVSSIDVSPGMLRELQKNATERGLTNLTTHARVTDTSGKVDFALSLIVLQHIPVERGLAAILEIWERLAPGGVLALEVPILSRRAGLLRFADALRHRFPVLQRLANRLRGRPAHDGVMQMNLYPLARIAEELFARDASAVTLLPSEPDPNYPGALIVCRKAG